MFADGVTAESVAPYPGLRHDLPCLLERRAHGGQRDSSRDMRPPHAHHTVPEAPPDSECNGGIDGRDGVREDIHAVGECFEVLYRGTRPETHRQDVFRAPYVSPRAAWLAADTITADCTFATRGVCVRFTLDGDLEEQAGDVPAGEASVPVGIDDRPGSPLHTTRDARECCDITIVIGSLPKLPPGILAHISLPSTSL